MELVDEQARDIGCGEIFRHFRVHDPCGKLFAHGPGLIFQRFSPVEISCPQEPKQLPASGQFPVVAKATVLDKSFGSEARHSRSLPPKSEGFVASVERLKESEGHEVRFAPGEYSFVNTRACVHERH